MNATETKALVKLLIAQALLRTKWTKYRLAQDLGYKSVSVIYRVEKGEAGISAEKFARLVELAGGSLPKQPTPTQQQQAHGGGLYIMSSLWHQVKAAFYKLYVTNPEPLAA